MVLQFLGRLIDAAVDINALMFVVTPWRFLFSADYRARKQREWAERPHRASLEQAGGLLIALFTIGLVTVFWMLILSSHSTAL